MIVNRRERERKRFFFEISKNTYFCIHKPGSIKVEKERKKAYFIGGVLINLILIF
jgi:hypothetical protein